MEFSIYRTPVELVKHLQLNVSKIATFEMVVRTSNVLNDALRRMEIDPKKKLNVRCMNV